MSRRIISQANPSQLVQGRWHQIPDVQAGKPLFVMSVEREASKTVVTARNEKGDVYEIIMVAIEVAEKTNYLLELIKGIWSKIKDIFSNNGNVSNRR